MKYNRIIKLATAISFMCAVTMSGCAYANITNNVFLAENKNVSEVKSTEKNKTDLKKIKKPENSENKKENAKKTEKENKSENETIKKEINKIISINKKPLSDEDFMFNGISLGDSVKSLKKVLGKSDSVIEGNIRDKYVWGNFDVTVEKEFPYSYIKRQDLNLKKVISGTGISSFYIFGKNAETYRNISVGTSRESVIRSYGKPSQLLWDGKENSYYFVYQKGNKKIYFNIKDDKVKSITVSLTPPEYYKEDNHIKTDKISVTDSDLTIAGFKLGDKFEPHPWQSWISKNTGVSEEVWYYPGYGVRVTSKSKLINGLFLDNSGMLTSRGIAKGDLQSTLEYIYGEPDKVEVSTEGNNPQTAYIYFSPSKMNLMVVYINKGKISNVVITKNIN